MALPASNAFSTNGQQFTDASAVAKYFKIRFAEGDLKNLFEFGSPTLKAFGPFKADLDGEKTLMPMLLGQPQGMGASLAAALRNMTSSKVDRWTITTGGFYGGVSIDRKSLFGSKSTVGAYVNLKEQEWKLNLQAQGQEFEKQIWQDGTGSEGNLTADPGTGTTWTVGTGDIVNFAEGMRFLVYADSSGVPGTVRAGGPYEIAGVDYQLGTFITTAAANAAAAVGDHLVRDGSVPISGVNQLMVGVPAWIPATAPGSTPFFGVNREPYPQLLAGWRGTWKGSIEETVKTLHAQMARLMNPEVSLWLSTANYNRFDIELGARAIRDANGGNAVAGFAGVSVISAGVKIKLRTSPYIPDDRGYLLDDSTWELHSLGPCPHFMNEGGSQWRPTWTASDGDNSTDGIIATWCAWPQLICRRPFANATFAIQ